VADDQLRSFFHSLKTEGDLQNLVTDKTEESVYLDFKQKRDRRDGKLHDDDKKNLSIALSGFANTDGGVLIWGIATAGTPDRADSLKPISDGPGFETRLVKSILSSTQPPVSAVDHKFIPTVNTPTEGYVIFLIPTSDSTPHQSLIDKHYYRRTTDQFYVMGHSELEDMFGRRPRPLLRLLLQLRPHPDGSNQEELMVRLRNDGRAIARYSGVLGRFLDPAVKLTGIADGLRDVTAINQGPAFQFDDHTVIHPNGILRAAGCVAIERPDKGTKLKLRVQWYCDLMRPRVLEFELEPGPWNELG